SRRERLVAGAGQDQRLDRTVAVGRFADRGHLLVHREGQRVARLRTVERDPADAVLDGIQKIFRRLDRGVHVTLFLFLGKQSKSVQATAAFGLDTTSRPFSTSIAAITPPARCGTLARSRPISTP